jgi:hypothetical protein
MVQNGNGDVSMAGTLRERMSTQDFARGLIAELVRRGRTSIEPHGADRAGFFRALAAVAQQVDQIADRKKNSPLHYDVVRIRNALKPSNNGAFDGLERLLRSQQLSLTASPNPFYEQIALSITTPYALALLSEFGQEQREVIESAAKAFVGDPE